MSQQLFRALTYVTSFLDWPISLATASCRRYRQQQQQQQHQNSRDDSTEKLIITHTDHSSNLANIDSNQAESSTVSSDTDSDCDEYVDAPEYFCGARGQLIIPTPVYFDALRVAPVPASDVVQRASGSCRRCYVAKSGDRRSLNMDLSGECGCFPLPFHPLKVLNFLNF